MSSPPKRKRRKPNRVPAIEKNPRLGYNIAVREFIGPHRLVVRTLGSQPRNTGSTPVGAAFHLAIARLDWQFMVDGKS